MLDRAKQLYELQKKARAIQKELKETEIEAESADGSVAVVFNGESHLVDIRISDEILNPERKSELIKNLKSTISQAVSRSQALAAEKMKAIAGDLKIPGF